MERSTSTGGEGQPTLPPRDMELTSNINIVPGLSGINLNILHALDMHMIDTYLVEVM
jgi:hypothetical protein